MIWVLLFTLIFKSGPDTNFFYPKLEKQLKQYVKDQSRQDSAIALFDEYKSAVKVFNKKNKEKSKEFHKINLDKNSSRQSFSKIIDSYLADRNKLDELAIESRMKMQELLHANEWNALMEDNEKNINKLSEERKKETEKLNKDLDKMKTNITEVFSEENKKTKAKKIIASFRENVDLYNNAVHKLDYNENQTLRNQNAGKEELSKILEETSTLRLKIISSYIDAHFQFAEITSQDEWDKISKIMNKPF